MLPCDVVHLSKTSSDSFASSSKSSHISGKANAGEVAEDINLLVDPIVGVAELPPYRVSSYEWVESSIGEHSSHFETTASLKLFSAII